MVVSLREPPGKLIKDKKQVEQQSTKINKYNLQFHNGALNMKKSLYGSKTKALDQ